MFNKAVIRSLALLALFAIVLAGAGAAAGAASVSPLGTEFRINERVEGDLATGGLASDADGDAVAVWFDDYSPWTIQARLIDKNGQPQGNQFTVATYGTGDLRNSEVAMDQNGRFVVAWEGTYIRPYNAAGVALSGPVKVNSGSGNTDAPNIAMSPTGRFVVAWGDDMTGSVSHTVKARLYDETFSPVGPEFTVAANGPYPLYARLNDVAMDKDGNFVVAYYTNYLDDLCLRVWLQRFDASGTAVGDAIDTGLCGRRATLAMDALGNFVLVYDDADGDGSGVWAKWYDSNGVLQYGPNQLNQQVTGHQGFGSADMTPSGELFVVWYSDHMAGSTTGEGYGVYGRHFDDNGEPLGAEYRVNTYPAGNPYEPLAAIDSEGDTLTVWASFKQDGYNYGLYGQMNEPVDPALPMLFSFQRRGKVGGLNYQPADIVKYDPASDVWSLYFDASDYKVRANLQDFVQLPDGDLLMTFSRPVKLPGVGKTRPQDIVRFDPTAGTWAMYLDGSDVDLTYGAEGLDAIALDRDGSLLLSTIGGVKVGDWAFQDEDVFRFTPAQLGDDTAGSWNQALDISYQVNYKDLWSLWIDTVSLDNYLYMTFERTIKINRPANPDIVVDNGSVLRCVPAYPEADGSYRGCTFDVYWNGQAAGLDRRAKIDGFEMLIP